MSRDRRLHGTGQATGDSIDAKAKPQKSLITNMQNEPKENVPLFKKWSYWYLLVLSVLIVLIIFFYWFTKKFS
jgi:hypothetical protein